MIHISDILCLLLLLPAIAFSVSLPGRDGTKTLSNAQRMARGLAPNPPRRLWGSQYTPRKVDRAVGGTFNGTIAVLDGSDIIGFVGWTGYIEYGVVNDVSSRTRVSITVDDPSQPTDLLVQANGMPGGYPYIGVSRGDRDTTDLGPGKFDYGWLVGVGASTGAGNQPSTTVAASKNYQSSAESTIWYLNPDSLELTAQHVESTTVINPVYFLWEVNYGPIITSDDPAATRAFASEPLTQVTLRLIP